MSLLLICVPLIFLPLLSSRFLVEIKVACVWKKKMLKLLVNVGIRVTTRKTLRRWSSSDRISASVSSGFSDYTVREIFSRSLYIRVSFVSLCERAVLIRIIEAYRSFPFLRFFRFSARRNGVDFSINNEWSIYFSDEPREIFEIYPLVSENNWLIQISFFIN